eukprot:TRINITY_DN5828_c0_g1_i1.p1 TRINITY_DN5828_c0_g1~~TRINITY_DN5828_c0_g1_i1.p1  ORF type:complete len:474 (-),score=85.12 TRINITY_DN5828_c0_g1_i1:379-1800(-)
MDNIESLLPGLAYLPVQPVNTKTVLDEKDYPLARDPDWKQKAKTLETASQEIQSNRKQASDESLDKVSKIWLKLGLLYAQYCEIKSSAKYFYSFVSYQKRKNVAKTSIREIFESDTIDRAQLGDLLFQYKSYLYLARIFNAYSYRDCISFYSSALYTLLGESFIRSLTATCPCDIEDVAGDTALSLEKMIEFIDKQSSSPNNSQSSKDSAFKAHLISVFQEVVIYRNRYILEYNEKDNKSAQLNSSKKSSSVQSSPASSRFNFLSVSETLDTKGSKSDSSSSSSTLDMAESVSYSTLLCIFLLSVICSLVGDDLETIRDRKLVQVSLARIIKSCFQIKYASTSSSSSTITSTPPSTPLSPSSKSIDMQQDIEILTIPTPQSLTLNNSINMINNDQQPYAWWSIHYYITFYEMFSSKSLLPNASNNDVDVVDDVNGDDNHVNASLPTSTLLNCLSTALFLSIYNGMNVLDFGSS